MICTHIYPLQVAVGLRRGNHRVVGVDDGHDVHAQQLLQRAVQVLPLVVIVEVQICDEDLSTVGGGGPELYMSYVNWEFCLKNERMKGLFCHKKYGAGFFCFFVLNLHRTLSMESFEKLMQVLMFFKDILA